MTELSTQVKTHVIVTFTKSHHFIAEKDLDSLRMLGAKDVFEFADGTRVAGSNIAEVLTVEKFYETHPEKRPAPELYSTADLLRESGMVGTINMIGTSGEKAMQSFIRGITKAISDLKAEGYTTFQAEKLLHHAELKLKQIQNHAT